MSDISETEYIAKTLYGEARGENDASKRSVAWVIRNRKVNGHWGDTYKSVVTARLQFTSWSQTVDPGNYAALQSPQGKPWSDCLLIAKEVIGADEKANLLPGVMHYYSPRAQAALHRMSPEQYPLKPDWSNLPSLQVPNPSGVPATSYAFYKNVFRHGSHHHRHRHHHLRHPVMHLA